MADTKISEMTAATSLADADLVPVVQGGVNKRGTVDLILDGITAARVNTALGYTAANAASLNAASLTGTLPDATFPAVLPAVSGANLTNLPGGISGLTAGVLPVATSSTAIGDSIFSQAGGVGLVAGDLLIGAAADIKIGRINGSLLSPRTSGGTFVGFFAEQYLGTDGAQQRFNLKANGTSPFLRFNSAGSVTWVDSTDESGASVDTAIVRAIAGVVRSTNGSTGDGGFQGVNLQGASSKALVAATPTGFVDIPVASDARIGGIIEYCVEADDGTDFQIESGVIQFAAVNKAGTVTTASPTATGTPLQVVNSGTLTAAFTATAGTGKITVNCDAASSLTETTLRIRFRVHVNSSTTAIAVAPL